MLEQMFMTCSHCTDCYWLPQCGGCDRLTCHQRVGRAMPDGPYDLHPGRPDFPERVAEVNGFSFSDIRALPLSLPRLPDAIPSLRRGDLGSRWDIASCIATTIEPFVARRDPKPLRRLHRMPRHAVAVITGCCKDRVLERLWQRRDSPHLIAALRRERPCLIIAPDYSPYPDDARCTHQYNAKRSLIVYARFRAAGLPCVPFASLHNEWDVRKWGAWLTLNRVVTAAGISFQTLQGHNDLWEQNARLLEALDKSTERRIHWLIIGVASPTRIQELRRRVGHFSVITGQPVQKGVRGYQVINGVPVRSLVADEGLLVRYNFQDLQRSCRGNLVMDLIEPSLDVPRKRSKPEDRPLAPGDASPQLALLP